MSHPCPIQRPPAPAAGVVSITKHDPRPDPEAPLPTDHAIPRPHPHPRTGPGPHPSPDRQWPRRFREAFCERFGCREAEYETALFRHCLFRHARPIAWIVRRYQPDFFREDFDLIREVGSMTRPDLFHAEVNYFYGRNLRNRNWLRRILRVRVSGGRLLRLQRRLFPRSR